MSTLLSEAIIDAKALREAALKNAETAVIEKYSQEVKETLDNLLEQDELDAEMPDLDAEMPDLGAEAAEPGTEDTIDEDNEIPLAATDDFSDLKGKNLKDFPHQGEQVDVTIDLGALQEAVAALGTEINENQEFDITAEDIARILSEEGDDCADEDDDEIVEVAGVSAPEDNLFDTQESGDTDDDDDDEDDEGSSSAEAETASASGIAATDAAQKGLEEKFDIDSLTDAIIEKLTVDMGATLSGWAGRSSESMKWEMEKEIAHRRSTDLQDDLETLKKAQEELIFENKQLNEQNTQYKQAVQELKEGLHDVNLSNARLLYTNRILRNTSLNERQKDKIVEAISNAGSAPEARTIFETLQSTVEATPKRSPQSLSEAISRRSSTIRASRKETPSSDPLQERMKRLAGIK
jgi:predicted nuclease with TOPRIM domain